MREKQHDRHVTAFILGHKAHITLLRWELHSFGINIRRSVQEAAAQDMLDQAYAEHYGMLPFEQPDDERHRPVYRKLFKRTSGACGIKTEAACPRPGAWKPLDGKQVLCSVHRRELERHIRVRRAENAPKQGHRLPGGVLIAARRAQAAKMTEQRVAQDAKRKAMAA